MVITREIRFRLVGAESEINLQEHAIVVASGGKPRALHQEATFFDTPDLQLYRKGVALTLHKEAKGWRQRLGKAPVLFARGDGKEGKAWSSKMADGILNVKKLKTSGAGRQLLGKIKPESLGRLFSLEFDRTSWRLDFPDGCRILLKEEKGAVTTEAERTPFHEISLELQNGDEGRLFQIALALLYQLSPRLETATPELRAFLHIDPSLAETYSKGGPSLTASMDAEEAFTRLAGHLTNLLEGNLAALLYGHEARRYDGLWEIAMAVEQFRGLLAFYDYLLPGIMRSELDEELEWLQNEMEPAKNWEEFVSGTLDPCIDQFPAYPALPELPNTARPFIREAYQRMEHAVTSFRFTRLICGLRYWVGGQAWRELTDLPQKRQAGRSVSLLAKSALERHHRQLIKLGEQGLTGDNDTALAKLDREGAATLIAVIFFGGLFQERRAKIYQNALDWVMTGVRGLRRVESGRSFFKQIIPADNEALGHLVNGWLGARREIFMLDTHDAWHVLASSDEFWQ